MRQSRLMREAERLDAVEHAALAVVYEKESNDPRRYEDVDGLPRWVHSCMRGPLVPAPVTYTPVFK